MPSGAPRSWKHNHLFSWLVRWGQLHSCSWPLWRREGNWFGWQWWWHGTQPQLPAARKSLQESIETRTSQTGGSHLHELWGCSAAQRLWIILAGSGIREPISTSQIYHFLTVSLYSASQCLCPSLVKYYSTVLSSESNAWQRVSTFSLASVVITRWHLNESLCSSIFSGQNLWEDTTANHYV